MPQRTSRRDVRPGSSPRNNRPARSGSGRTSTTAGRPRPRFTNRMAVLVVVAVLLVVSYASSMRAYLQQRSHISDLNAQIARSEKDIAALEKEKGRWSDKAYIEAQARQRFGWVLPGETSYQVVGRDGKPLSTSGTLPDPSSVAKPLRDPWWQRVYGTVQTADHPERVSTPATKITPRSADPSSSGG
ncbi:MAG: septum formation initiator family protein [Marmoricola sp.]|nr:septum formation initiator family protein [Marmoricola sp.]